MIAPTVRNNDLLWFPADHALRGGTHALPVTDKAPLHVNWCLSVRIGDTKCLYCPSQKRRANSGDFKIFNEISQNERLARTMKEVSFAQQTAWYDALIQDIAPVRWGLLAQRFIYFQRQAGPSCEARQGKAAGLRKVSLPLRHVPVMEGVWRNQVLYWTEGIVPLGVV